MQKNTIASSENSTFQRTLPLRQIKECSDTIRKDTNTFSSQLLPHSVLLIVAKLLHKGLAGRNKHSPVIFAGIYEAQSRTLHLQLQQAPKVNQDPPHFPAGTTLLLTPMQKHLTTRGSWRAFTTVASHKINYSFGYHTGKLNYLLQVAWMSRNIPSSYTVETVAAQVNSSAYYTTKSLGACLNLIFFSESLQNKEFNFTFSRHRFLPRVKGAQCFGRSIFYLEG